MFLGSTTYVNSQVIFQIQATAGLSHVTDPDKYYVFDDFDFLNPSHNPGFSNGLFFKGLVPVSKINFGFQAGFQMNSHRIHVFQEQESYSWLRRESLIRFRNYGYMLGGLIQLKAYSSEKLTISPEIGLNAYLPFYQQIYLRQTDLNYYEMKEETIKYQEGEFVSEELSFNRISNVDFVPSAAVILGFPAFSQHINLSFQYQRYINASLEQRAAQFNNFSLGLIYTFNPEKIDNKL